MISLVVLVGMLAGFARDRTPPSAIAVIGAATFLLLGYVGEKDALSVFSNGAVIAIASMLILTAALVRTGVLEALASRDSLLPDTAELTPTPGNTEGSFVTTTFDGRTVWETTNPKSMLYFRVPDTFDFVVGSPVYVRIEYHDSGRGRFFAEYDSNLGTSTSHRFWDSELHARSSRVGTGVFVNNYQMFESPLFDRRQNGSNDFRFQLSGSDGTPLRIAGVQISTQPFDDETFLYALSRPWRQPYTGQTLDLATTNTLVGKVMTGYQGWFGTPNDANDEGWRHWTRGSGSDPSPTQITIDMWPWLNEYRTQDLYPAGEMVHPDGRPAYLFSSRDPETVQRHFRWMRKHNIDGAYLQRFVSRSRSGFYGASEFVLSTVRAAANQEGRVWAIEYDVSSLEGDANPLEVMTNDWNFLVNDCHILDDPRYVHENGKPVLFIWGFSRRDFSLAEADSVLDWFGTQNLYLIAGVHSSWESETEWYGHYQKYDQLLAWMERTQSDLESQKARLDSWGMKILPHAWPGFSWNNLKMTVHPQSYTARDGGDFYWDKLFNAVSIGADQIFLGMFDEYDEGTAMMPMSDNHPDPHTEWGYYIDNEGQDPFWWLRLSAAGRDMLNGLRPLTSTLPSGTSVAASAMGGDIASVQLGVVNINDGIQHTQNGDGLTMGAVIDGSSCRTSLSNYFYFDIDDDLCFENANGQAITVEISFYDAYPGSGFRLQYDSLASAYQNAATVNPSASGGWKTIRWTVDDGYFGNRQNAGSDFRMNLTGAASATIRSVRVTFPEEQGAVSDPPRIELVDGVLAWPVLSDATGWRLNESHNLSSNTWTEVEGPFDLTPGRFLFDAPTTNDASFYKLQRPAIQ